MKKIISFILVLCLASIMFSVPTFAGSIYARGQYVAEFEKYMADNGCQPSYKGEEDWYMYSDSYYDYYSENNDTDTPDWLLAWGSTMGTSPLPTYGVFGDYYISINEYLYPYSLGYLVYVPSESKFYTLEEAWIAGFEGIEKAFTEALIPRGLAGYIGDADRDNNLSVMDATFIQRNLAGMCVFDSRDDLTMHTKATDTASLSYVSDVDRDGKRTIIDATAIQRKLAQLDVPVDTPVEG
ncbi:MAG: hypothetical protein E7513_06665 [Ruminococcaceae bacterium]|nr:hypothetical protein [Oscillospiraceae bacterium]